MHRQDPYRSFASRYDAFEGRSDLRASFFEALFREHQVLSLLDCACGTGNDLLLFDSLGFDVVGSDLSESMVAEARRKIEVAGAEIALAVADFRELETHFDEPFDAVTCLSTSLPHLLEEAEIVRALRSMRAVLRPGGILVLDQGMTDRQWEAKPRFLPAINTPNLSRLMAIDYGDETFTVHVLDFAGGENERTFHHDTFIYRRLLGDDYLRVLEDAGFRLIRLLGGFDGAPYSRNESPRLIAVAEG